MAHRIHVQRAQDANLKASTLIVPMKNNKISLLSVINLFPDNGNQVVSK